MTISLAKRSDDLTTAEPFYSDLSKGNKIKSHVGLIYLIDALKDELKKVSGDLWQRVRHNLTYGIYLRGQNSMSDDLLPSAGRASAGRGPYTPEQERNLLHRFRRRSYGHYGRILTDWETLFLARHHFLPCRLLDWSSNPLVALYWACRGKLESDGAVWAFVRQPDEKWDLNVFDAPLCNYKYGGDFEFLVRGVKVIYPFDVSPRITAQGCVFTYQDQPEKALQTYDPKFYRRELFDLFHVRKWKVPAGSKGDLLTELNDLGVNLQTLLPDLQGLGEGIPEIEGLRLSQAVEQ